MENELLSVMEVAKELNVSDQIIRLRIKAGKLKARQLSNIWVINRLDLNSYLEAEKTRSTRKRPMPELGPDEVTTRHAADLLDVTLNTIEQFVKKGKLKGEKKGADYVIDLPALETFAATYQKPEYIKNGGHRQKGVK
jgi:excisionase family DNA binding protein